jgi:hypothetical protein
VGRVGAGDGDAGELGETRADGGIGAGEVFVGELAVGIDVAGEDGVDVVGARLDPGEAVGAIESDGGGVEHVGDLVHPFRGGGHGALLLIGLWLGRRGVLAGTLGHHVGDALHHVLAGMAGGGGLEHDLGEAGGRVSVRAEDVSADGAADDVWSLLSGEMKREQKRDREEECGSGRDAHRYCLRYKFRDAITI